MATTATQLHDLTACQAAAKIRSGEISPVELIRALLERIDRYDAGVKAWEAVDADGALAAARDCERRRAEAGDRPLFGVPFAAKDIFYSKGLRTAAGFKPWDSFVPDYDANSVARLRAAGGVLLGKTTTTQFANQDPSKTRNPWNEKRSPAGSSSGSGAAVAARMVPLALGTQTGGSIQRPAAFNGCVGLKATYGRISRHGVVPLSWSLDHPGPLARSVEDAALALQICSGHDPNDPGSVRAPVPDFVGALQGDIVPPRFGLVRDLVDGAEPEVRDHVLAVVQRLEHAGAEIHEVSYPGGMPLILAVQSLIGNVEGASVHLSLWSREREHYGPRFRAHVEIGQLIPSAAYVQAQRLRRQLRGQIDELLQSVDCLIAPTASTVAVDPSTTGSPAFQSPNSLFGLPAISLPTGLSVERLPFSTQLITRRLDEVTLFRAAHWCEQTLDPMPAPF